MNSKSKRHIEECRRQLQKADAQDKPGIKDPTAAYCIGALILAIDQLAEAVVQMKLTDEQVDHLIGARNRITDVMSDFPDFAASDHIDFVLRDIPIGQRPDVDALLGRRSETDIELTRRIWRETEATEY